MALLALSVLLFAAIHILPAFPEAKARLKRELGRAYAPTYGFASVAALLLIVLAWQSAERSPVYAPPEGAIYVTFALVFVAFLCIGVAIFRGSLRKHLRLPLAFAAILWGLGHLASNGDDASIVLFGGLALYGVAHLILGLANGVRPQPETRAGHDLLSLLTGLALFAVMAQLHQTLIGVPVAVWLRA